jgi:hypothetical protein
LKISASAGATAIRDCEPDAAAGQSSLTATADTTVVRYATGDRDMALDPYQKPLAVRHSSRIVGRCADHCLLSSR